MMRTFEMSLWIVLLALVVLPRALGLLRRRGEARHLSAPPPPSKTPYRTSGAVEQAVRSQVALVHSSEEHVAAAMLEIEYAFTERDRYQHALEAISLIGQDGTAQRIALQALKKPELLK